MLFLKVSPYPLSIAECNHYVEITGVDDTGISYWSWATNGNKSTNINNTGIGIVYIIPK